MYENPYIISSFDLNLVSVASIYMIFVPGYSFISKFAISLNSYQVQYDQMKKYVQKHIPVSSFFLFGMTNDDSVFIFAASSAFADDVVPTTFVFPPSCLLTVYAETKPRLLAASPLFSCVTLSLALSSFSISTDASLELSLLGNVKVSWSLSNKFAISFYLLCITSLILTSNHVKYKWSNLIGWYYLNSSYV